MNAIRDFTNESSDQSLRTTGFETVKHACFGDSLLQQIHQDSSHQSAGNNGSDAVDGNTQACPGGVYGPVVEEASQTGEGAGNGGRQQIPTLVRENRKADFGSKTLADANDQGTADALGIAHGEFYSGSKGFGEQRSTRLSHNKGGQRSCK